MSNNIVIVIHQSEDGPSIERMTKDALLKRLKEGYWGLGNHGPTFCPVGSVPDFDRGGNVLTIIEGDVIVPKVVKVVEEYEL